MYVELGRQIFSANLANFGFLQNIYFEPKILRQVFFSNPVPKIGDAAFLRRQIVRPFWSKMIWPTFLFDRINRKSKIAFTGF